MSVPFLKAAAAAGNDEALVRFVRLHLGDGNDSVGRREIDKSWAEAIKILLAGEAPDDGLIREILTRDDATLALLYFHLHFHLVKKSKEWIHDGSR